MSFFPDATDEQRKMALAMAMMSGGAAMMDPRGTYGSAGAALNQGFQAGMGSYMPMMQFAQKAAERKEEKDYRKKRDRMTDRFRKNQETLQAATMELREKQLGISQQNANTNAGMKALQGQLMQFQIDQAKTQQKMMEQFMPKPNKVSELRAQDTGMGPLKTNVPQQFGPRVETPPQQPGMQEMTSLSQFNPLMAQQQQAGAAAASIPQTVAPPAPQAAPMSGYDMMNLGGYLDMPGMQQQGKDMSEIQKFATKEAMKLGMKANEVGVRGDPLGLGYIIYKKGDGSPIGKIGPDMNFIPAPGQSGVISAEDYFK